MMGADIDTLADNDGFVLMVFLFFLMVAMFGFGIWMGETVARKSEREAAVKAGVGRWVTDRSTGETDFIYGVDDR